MNDNDVTFDAARHLSVEYKTTGRNLLTMLASDFPHACLQDDDFDALVEDMANDLAERCCAPLAAHLAPHGLDLWEIDFSDDTRNVAIVPQVHAEAFQAYWREGFRNNPDEYRTSRPKLRRVKPAGASGENGAAKARKVDLIVEKVTLAATPDLAIDRSIDLLRSPYSDHPDNGKYVDFSTWPPRPLPLPDAASDRAFVRAWQPVFQRGTRNVWRCLDPVDREQLRADPTLRLAQIDDIHAWSPRWLGCDARLSSDHAPTLALHDGLLHIARSPAPKGRHVYQVVSVTDNAAQVWLTSHRPLEVYPVDGERRCLIVEDGSLFAIADGPITRDAYMALPKPVYRGSNGVIALRSDTLVYFNGTKTALRMHKLAPATMESSSVLLADFGYRGIDRGEKYQGFDVLDVRRGHGDWWILNHASGHFGEIDIALLWNAATDETIKIGQRDIALEKPSIVYLRSVDRYLAVSCNTVALLLPFDALYAAKEKVTLQWEAK